MDNVPDGAVRYGRRRPSARIAGLAAYCAALAIVLGVVAVAVFLSQTNHELQHMQQIQRAQLAHMPSPGASLSSPLTTCWPTRCEFPLRNAAPIPGVDFLPAQIAGIGSLLAAIGAIACGAVAVSKLRRSAARATSRPDGFADFHA